MPCHGHYECVSEHGSCKASKICQSALLFGCKAPCLSCHIQASISYQPHTFPSNHVLGPEQCFFCCIPWMPSLLYHYVYAHASDVHFCFDCSCAHSGFQLTMPRLSPTSCRLILHKYLFLHHVHQVFEDLQMPGRCAFAEYLQSCSLSIISNRFFP